LIRHACLCASPSTQCPVTTCVRRLAAASTSYAGGIYRSVTDILHRLHYASRLPVLFSTSAGLPTIWTRRGRMPSRYVIRGTFRRVLAPSSARLQGGLRLWANDTATTGRRPPPTFPPTSRSAGLCWRGDHSPSLSFAVQVVTSSPVGTPENTRAFLAALDPPAVTAPQNWHPA